MTSDGDGLAIAQARIAAERQARTGRLDLAGLGLARLPDELFGLTWLEELELGHSAQAGPFGRNAVAAELPRLAALPALRLLGLRSTEAADLSPLARLTALEALDCSFTPVVDLGPLAQLARLRSLACAVTKVVDLRPLAGLAALESLLCWDTRVDDLGPLRGLPRLRRVNCSVTGVTDLRPLAECPALEELDAAGCRLRELPDALLRHPALTRLRLHDATIPGIPPRLLARHDCLPDLRAHRAELAEGAEELRDAKLLLLGNSGAGKTQIARWLGGEDFRADRPATPGIRITRSARDDVPPLQIWDFAGDDDLLGLHALFLRTPGIFLLAWSQETEDAAPQAEHGVAARNRPLDDWAVLAAHHAQDRNPVLVVQARCDSAVEERLRAPVDEALLEEVPFFNTLALGVRTGRGLPAFTQALRQAAASLQAGGAPRIGRRSLAVKRRLEAMRKDRRWLTRAQFEAILAEEGGLMRADLLLGFLHDAGTIFHAPGLFADRILLDPGWVVEAVHAVFARGACREVVQAQGGRFTRRQLGQLAWPDRTAAEQELLLGLMRDGGLCFRHRDAGADDTTEYIAPDLLPGRAEVQGDLDGRWRADLPGEEAVFGFPLLHGALIHAVIARIGDQAGSHGLYWRGGACCFDTTSRSRALVEQEMTGGWSGRIRLRTQGGHAWQLLEELCRWVAEDARRLGLHMQERPDALTDAPPDAARLASPRLGADPDPAG
jgi:internalin A